jgi:hypothetical protein
VPDTKIHLLNGVEEEARISIFASIFYKTRTKYSLPLSLGRINKIRSNKEERRDGEGSKSLLKTIKCDSSRIASSNQESECSPWSHSQPIHSLLAN